MPKLHDENILFQCLPPELNEKSWGDNRELQKQRGQLRNKFILVNYKVIQYYRKVLCNGEVAIYLKLEIRVERHVCDRMVLKCEAIRT